MSGGHHRCSPCVARARIMDYLIISDIPTPWREPVFERVYQKLDGALHVVYFNSNERRRLWTFEKGSHPKTILKAVTLTASGTERFFNPGIVPFLLRRNPRVALVCASIKDPTAWLAMGLCRLLGTKVGLISDTWLGRDFGIGVLQRLARRVVYNNCGDAFVGASRQTLAMFRHYNSRILDEQCFLSHLVADNEYFERRLTGRVLERRFDVMFSGRIVEVKNPAFFAEVCAGIKRRLGQCRVLIIGEGEAALKTKMRDIFEHHSVSVEFAGFIPHTALPDYYAQSRLLLLPTSGDCWGVVINEAMVAGTPVITTGLTGAAGELVLHDRNGYILPLDVQAWASAATDLLSDQARWESFSECARWRVKEFNYDNAASGILDAFAYLAKRR
jgi:glycosyltransferase involved in cell wall biosynthesis